MEKFQECKILGVNINVMNMNDVVEYIEDNIQNLKGKYICVSNVHTTVMSYENPQYKDVQNNAILRLPDGKPLSVVQRKRGFKNASRVTGPDLMKVLFEHSNSNLKHYFFGSTDETLSKLEYHLKSNYPKLDICGLYSPPFRKLTPKEDEEIIKKINNSGANILWVGLGAPKQENWMFEHMDKINALMIGVGAGFDYHAGNIKRAPKWMQKCSLEWLYRLMQDPKRLFGRYIKTNFKFIWLIFRGK